MYTIITPTLSTRISTLSCVRITHAHVTHPPPLYLPLSYVVMETHRSTRTHLYERKRLWKVVARLDSPMIPSASCDFSMLVSLVWQPMTMGAEEGRSTCVFACMHVCVCIYKSV